MQNYVKEQRNLSQISILKFIAIIISPFTYPEEEYAIAKILQEK